jgi:hypothetical protein
MGHARTTLGDFWGWTRCSAECPIYGVFPRNHPREPRTGFGGQGLVVVDEETNHLGLGEEGEAVDAGRDSWSRSRRVRVGCGCHPLSPAIPGYHKTRTDDRLPRMPEHLPLPNIRSGCRGRSDTYVPAGSCRVRSAVQSADPSSSGYPQPELQSADRRPRATDRSSSCRRAR